MPHKQTIATSKKQNQADTASSIKEEKETDDLGKKDEKDRLTPNVVANETSTNKHDSSPHFKIDFHYSSVPDSPPHYLPRLIEILDFN